MTEKIRKAKAPAEKANDAIYAPKQENETTFQATARAILQPGFRHGQATAQLYSSQFKNSGFAPGLADYTDGITPYAKQAEKGDLSFASRMLAAQAMTLDAIFTEMARRMACNMGEYLGATETYARIAMKAQAGSRAAVETLAKLHQPREQTVRHVHVNEGGQAVIADEFHNHTGGSENGQSGEQPHATGAASTSTALPCPDPLRNGVPIAGCEGRQTVSDARRQGQRRT